MEFIIVIGVLMLFCNVALFSFGVYYIRKAKKQQKDFLEIEVEFSEYMEFKKEMRCFN